MTRETAIKTAGKVWFQGLGVLFLLSLLSRGRGPIGLLFGYGLMATIAVSCIAFVGVVGFLLVRFVAPRLWRWARARSWWWLLFALPLALGQALLHRHH